MNARANRRDFLRQSAVCSAVAASGLIGTCRIPRARAIEPVVRETTGTKYKFTLAGYSYRKLLTGQNPPCTLEDFVKDCARFGLEGTEPTSYYFPQPVTSEYLCRLKGLAFRLGLSISSTAVGNNFCLPPGEARDKQIADVKQWVDYAEILGAPIIRIFSGSQNKQQTAEEAIRLAVEAIEECCEYSGRKGIYLGLENHGGLTGTAESMLQIVRAVSSPWFGVWMDTGNFRSGDVYGELEAIARYTIHVQVKVVMSSPDGGSQPADYPRIARILADVGYRGWICLEYEEDDDPRTACPAHLQKLRAAFSA
ncbi:MAG: sugar phosphate isomerase/epimerase [Planctomycetes bacterium]|nr:sugar phosphate isomerase/epimerase [Planctomycetota bacterium]